MRVHSCGAGFHRLKMINSNSQSVFEVTLSGSQGCLLAARDEAGTLLAAIFYVWDSSVTYCRLTTRAPRTHSGVVTRLIWEAMRESVGATPTMAAAASFLALHVPWVAPHATVTAVARLIVALSVEGFCAWSEQYLAKYSKTLDLTGSGRDNG
jgi:hypothetical protein